MMSANRRSAIVNLKNGNSATVCSQCGVNGPERPDAGDAAEASRRKGWITIPGAREASQRSWLCPKCKTAHG